MKLAHNPHKLIVYILAIVAIVAIFGTRIYEVPPHEPVKTETFEAAATKKAEVAIKALKDKDAKVMSKIVHPTKGVRFSPYGFVDAQNDVVLTRDKILNAFNDQTIYNWGIFDGSGMPIELTFNDYYEQFIYDKDFAKAEKIGINKIIGQGNSINNIFEVYPDGFMVEYHFSGFNPDFDGLDWESLRLVFELDDGEWFLVGAVHDQWTI